MPSLRGRNPDTALLDGFHEDVNAGRLGYVDGVLVVQGGEAVFEHEYDHDYAAVNAGYRTSDRYRNEHLYPYYRGGRLHTLQSITKSVVGLTYGIAIGRGIIPGVHTPLTELLPLEMLDDDKGWRGGISLMHLLTMTAGIEWAELSIGYGDPRNSCRQMEESNDWTEYVLSQPIISTPGEKFEYNSGISQLLAAVFLRAAGTDIDTFAEEHLFDPLGITEYHWSRTPEGRPDAEGGLYLSLRDLGKIGQLVLQRGRWSDVQVVSDRWITMSVKPWVPQTGLYGDGERDRAYGLQWWLVPHGRDVVQYAYTGLGYGGQRLFILPDREVVAAFTGWNIYEHQSLPIGTLHRVILPALEPTP